MSDHINTVKKAIEFKKPDYLPMETLDIPGIYNAYNTLDPDTVDIIPGTEDFDSMWTNCYSWFHREIGKTVQGESLRKDQFGTLLKIPNDMNTTYIIMENPLSDKKSLKGFEFPDPDDTDPFYEKLGNTIKERYSDRFIDGFIDAGLMLTTMMLFGETEFLIKTIDDINFVVEVYERVMEYYKALVIKYKRAGAHMITDIEDIGSTAGLLFSPEVWRKHFKPVLTKFFKFIHEQGLYTGLLIDGNYGQILDDLPDMEIDVFTTVDVNMTGIELLKEKLKGKICLKATVDMQRTLPLGTPDEVEKEAQELVNNLNTPDGGFICEVVRWYRPSYRDENVLASVRAFNRFRKGV